MRKRQLELALSRLRHSPSPILSLEAYDLDPKAATELLYIAEEKYHDIADRSVVDLGCGSGILTIGAALLGCKDVLGIDINKESVLTARENSNKLGVDIDLMVGDIAVVRGKFDTAVMNPPFGTRTRGADVVFLQRAIELSKVAYSLHKRTERSRQFLSERIRKMGGHVDAVFELEVTIPRTYEFHRERSHRVAVDLYRITSQSAAAILRASSNSLSRGHET